jgi:hypothetical protein
MSAGGSKLAWCTFFPFLNLLFGNTCNSDLDPIGAIIVSDISQVACWDSTLYRSLLQLLWPGLAPSIHSLNC